MRLVLVVVIAACGRVSFDPPHDAAVDATSAPAPRLGVGGWNSCVIVGDGDVACWGRGDAGQLGDGSIISRGIPGPVSLPIRAVALDTNDAGTCASDGLGTAWCWGSNERGQLGLGDRTITGTPRRVLDADVAEVALGYAVGCIRRRSGAVACAGAGSIFGEPADRVTFIDMAGVTDAISIAAGDEFMCALLASGAVSCWGANYGGSLGDGTMNHRPTPGPGPVGPYTQIAAGDQFACGLRGTSVECWGDNTDGQLGTTGIPSSPVALPVDGITDVVQLATTSATTCALHSTGLVSCWGSNAQGELGNGAGAGSVTPVAVALDDVIEIAGNTSLHLCARRRDESIWCWGNNAHGQLGIGSVGPESRVPVRTVFP